MPADLSTIVYVSSAASLMTPLELDLLLEQSRERNARDRITGLLLYCDGNFMQCIEGTSASIQNLYDSIVRDPRHYGLVQLTHHPIERREFPDWAMAFSLADKPQMKLLNPTRRGPGGEPTEGPITVQLLSGFWREQMGIARTNRGGVLKRDAL